MDKELSQKICKRFRWFCNWKTNELLDEFSFECDDGWYYLIWVLCTDLEKAGFNGSVTQCKEKFGTLRWYIDSGTPEQYEIIRQYEEKSFTTCEVCGAEGKIRHDLGWIKTLCEEHYLERKRERRNNYGNV